MRCKGVVVVPSGSSNCCAGDGAPGTQRIANRPIVCHVLDAVCAAGASEIAVVGATEALAEVRQSLDERGADVTYFAHGGRAGLLRALATALEFVGEAPCLVHTAAGVAGQPLAPFAELLESDQADLMLLLHRTSGTHDHMGLAMERLLGIAQLNGSKRRLGLAEVCLFGPGALRRLSNGVQDSDAGSDLTAIAERIAHSGEEVRTGFLHTWRCYRGNTLDLLELNRIVLDQQTAEDEPFEGEGNRIEGRVVIHPTAEVVSSVVLGPSVIGARARVADSYVGPYTSIGAGARIEGAEIERSIILEGARIMHVSDRIEASTVGARASIFRDFGLPRALRLHVGEGVEVALN